MNDPCDFAELDEVDDEVHDDDIDDYDEWEDGDQFTARMRIKTNAIETTRCFKATFQTMTRIR